MTHRILTTIVTALTISMATAQSARQPDVPAGQLAEEGAQDEEIGNYDFIYTGGGETLDLMTANILDEARKHLGARYVHGGKGPTVFDCSGFTSYVYKQQNGIYIGASPREQFARLTPIKRSEMQAGDIVFFTSPRSGRNVGHVGIVVSVDRAADTFTFIHASSTSGVKISASTDGYYQRRYVGVRRVE